MHHCPSLWAGTNAGHIFVCYLSIPEGEKRTEEEIQVEIGKEIKLKHKAPVVSMFVVDKEGKPLLSDVVADEGKGNVCLNSFTCMFLSLAIIFIIKTFFSLCSIC